VRAPVDGKLRSESEICQMVIPEDDNVYQFEAHGKRYQVRIYFPSVPYSQNSVEAFEDGRTLGRTPNDEKRIGMRKANRYRMRGAYVTPKDSLEAYQRQSPRPFYGHGVDL
jgi:hypothetical protein